MSQYRGQNHRPEHLFTDAQKHRSWAKSFYFNGTSNENRMIISSRAQNRRRSTAQSCNIRFRSMHSADAGLTMHKESWWGFIVELTWLLWIEMAHASLSGSCCRLRYSPPDALKIQRSLFITSTAPQRNRTRGRPVGEGFLRMMGCHNISLHAFKSSEICWCSRNRPRTAIKEWYLGKSQSHSRTC